MKLLFSVLAVSDKWFFDVFQAIRVKQMAAMNSDYLQVMIILASIIIAFKLIKLSYTIMSDEQNGGFGGISMWEVLRPLVVLVLIINCSFVTNLIDGTCNMVSTALVNDTGYTRIKEDLGKTIDDAESWFDKNKDDIKETAQKAWNEKALAQGGLSTNDALAAAKGSADNKIYAENKSKQRVESAYDAIEREFKKAGVQAPSRTKDQLNYAGYELKSGKVFMIYDTIKVYNPAFASEAKKLRAGLSAESQTIIDQALKTIETGGKEGTGFTDQILDVAAANVGASKRLQKETTIMASITLWLFDMLFTVMMAFSEIFLMIMAVMLPITLTLSLFDKWKDSFSSWAGRYIEISLWKLTGALIVVAVSKAKAAVLEFTRDSSMTALDNLTDFTKDFSSSDIIAMDSALIIITCIGIAGIISLISIPSITNTAISLSTESAVSGAETGGGTAKGILFAPAKATAGGVKAAKTIKGLK